MNKKYALLIVGLLSLHFGAAITLKAEQENVVVELNDNSVDRLEAIYAAHKDGIVDCISVRADIDLLEKFCILASAKSYVGIDSGLTHLALMTETPILVIHPKVWDANSFYSGKIKFLEI